MKNPPWTRDELILALDLYYDLEFSQMDASNPRIMQLSDVLNELPLHDPKPDVEKFRNPNGVSMKLNNFKAIDPRYEGKGLWRGGKLDRVIWDEFSKDRHRLRATAQLILTNYKTVSEPKTVAIDSDEEEFIEGRIQTRIHKLKERNSALVRKKKALVMKKTGTLKCEVCGFDFKEFYGPIGDGFAECHHRVAIGSLRAESRTKLSDLAVVCANCHRMLHRANITMEELTRMLKSR